MAKAKRRQIRFADIAEALQEVDRLVAAEQAGRLSHTGNWSLGQTFGHLATWCNFAFDGYPPVVKASAPTRALFRILRPLVLNRGMMTGVKVGKSPGGTLGMEEMHPADGAQRFRTALQRLAGQCPTLPNPLFGYLSHEQWIALNLRHAELHLSFQHAAAD